MDNREKTVRYLAEQERIVSELRKGKTSDQILETQYKEVHASVPGFIVPGLTILAGAPKIGKSWVVLGIACALATGGRVFGEIKVEETEVLALCLEDTERRVKDRLVKMWARGSSKLHVRTEWPMGKKGLQYLDAWLSYYSNTKVIFVDTMQRLAGIEKINDYRETYEAAEGIKKVADKYGAAIVAIHHTSKFPTRDFIHSVNGSVGLTGAADTIITMQRPRKQGDGILSVTGRDIEEREIGIRFDPTLGTWTFLEEIPPVAEPPKQQQYWDRDNED